MLLFLNHHRLSSHTSELQGVIFLCAVCFHAITRPYKLNSMNNVDIAILFLLEILTFAAISPVPDSLAYLILASTLLLGVPHMVLIFYLCCKLTKKTRISQSLKRKYRTLKRCALATVLTSQADTDVDAESDTADFLPDRLINQGEYEPVLPIREEHIAANPSCTEDEKPFNEYPRKMIPVYTYGSLT